MSQAVDMLADIEIAGLTADSRSVEPGYLFAALPSVIADSPMNGINFVPEALRRGAAAVLGPPGLAANLEAPIDVPVIEDEDPRRRLSQLAARFFAEQPRTIVAVTGTAGKSSVADFVCQIWLAMGISGGSMGTLGINSAPLQRPLAHTTPDPVVLHEALRDLAAAGVRPEEVDFVLCTHLHVDHAGWNTQLINGRWVPTFPNAKYIFARTEYEFWERRHLDGSEGPVPNVYDDSILPVMQAGQAVLVDADHQIDDGLWFEPAPGHTPGNVVVNLQSQGATGVLTGDVMHHPLQLIRPEWSSRACEDPVQSAATRRALIERYADTDTLIAPAHFASPTMGHIISKGDGFGYRLVNED